MHMLQLTIGHVLVVHSHHQTTLSDVDRSRILILQTLISEMGNIHVLL